MSNTLPRSVSDVSRVLAARPEMLSRAETLRDSQVTGPEPSALTSWPEPLAEPAFHGLAGEFVRTIEPHTEADPAGLLIQFLAAVGCMVGRNVYFRAEADRHYPNLFACLVGVSSRGRL
jgi:hypothetical protein